jgi:hypothetical protein
MRKTSLLSAVACFAVAAVILVFADGARRVYAGAFFLMLGVVVLVNAKRGMHKQQ